MSGAEALVPMVICTTMFATIFGIYYMRSRENMAMIERGMNPRQGYYSSKPYNNLKYGLLLCGAGLGLLIAFLLDSNMDHTRHTFNGSTYEDDNPAIYFSLIAVGGGLGLVISYIAEKKDILRKRKDEPELE